MTGSSLATSDKGQGATVRFPVLPGRTPVAQGADTTCEAYKAGHRDASIAYAEEKAALERSHQAFVDSVGVMLSDMEARYRDEALALIARLFTAVAPAMARGSALSEIMSLVSDRARHSDDELKLRVHPDLVSHLSETDQKKLSDNPQIILETDPSCAPSSIDARWSKGGFCHDPDALIKEILTALDAPSVPQEEQGNE
ncbi:hypothetical protein PUV54_16405 [Hyphococcus flavus]|uniref:Flagellar assembly protein FliH/Type III secretion system HrpE domain-containing protein n=1 Tax=Hyphococcus flavus TaxID=1866326 RepID=A0AAE9ZBF6_9PROT|nr:hypothetical protein [Hyphococcus flavus]WDI31534.1 hypothetical protein PUV54_16405 [Hyphococcus flavus]